MFCPAEPLGCRFGCVSSPSWFQGASHDLRGFCLYTGAAGFTGLSIEDATGDSAQPLYELDLAVERIKAARVAIDGSGVPVVLTARCEAYLVGVPNPARV